MAAGAPDYDALVDDLARLRRAGITALRELDLPALEQVARACGVLADDRPVTAPTLEATIREGLVMLGDGRLGEIGALLFGLEAGTRGDEPAQLRRDAAERWGVSVSQFRHRYEPVIISQLAEVLLARAETRRLRQASLAMQQRSPVESRLAVAWLERFETYYAMWSNLYGLGNSLTWARRFELDYPGGPASDNDDKAVVYRAEGLVYYTVYLTQLQAFMTRYGGLWLFTDPTVETGVVDALDRIREHSPFTSADRSYLRNLMAASGTDTHPFLDSLRADPIGVSLREDWHQWAQTCQCSWEGPNHHDTGYSGDQLPPGPTASTPTGEAFPTWRNHPGITPACHVHQAITGTSDYIRLIDDDWHHIADWYEVDMGR